LPLVLEIAQLEQQALREATVESKPVPTD
jgi:hypothetical protein